MEIKGFQKPLTVTHVDCIFIADVQSAGGEEWKRHGGEVPASVLGSGGVLLSSPADQCRGW